MRIIPAIDIKDGRCVRLVQGDFDHVTVYYPDPVEAADHLKDQGVELIHIVDLDGAVLGRPVHYQCVEKIIEKHGLGVEIGGGIRHVSDAEKYLNMGVERVILGTVAHENPSVYQRLFRKYDPSRVVVSVDSKDGWVAIAGWQETTVTSSLDFIRHLEKEGFKTVIFTDIRRDGMMVGPNLESIKNVLQHSTMNIVISGGVSSMDDLRNILTLPHQSRIDGIIIGKALYEKKIELSSAINLLKAGK